MAGVTFDLNEAQQGATNNALNMARVQQYGQQMQDQRTFRSTAAQAKAPDGAYDFEKHAKLLEDNAMPMEAEQLRKMAVDRQQRQVMNSLQAMQTRTAALDLIRKTAPLITNEEEYNNFRAGLIQEKFVDPTYLPEKYDPKALARLTHDTNEAFKIITKNIGGGKKQDYQVVRDKSGSNALAKWGEEYSDADKDANKPTNNFREAKELVEKGLPEPIANMVAYNTAKQFVDNLGRPFIIDVATSQEIGHMERDPQNPLRQVWVPNPAFKQQAQGRQQAAPGAVQPPMPVAGPVAGPGGRTNVLQGRPTNVGPSGDPNDIRRFLMQP